MYLITAGAVSCQLFILAAIDQVNQEGLPGRAATTPGPIKKNNFYLYIKINKIAKKAHIQSQTLRACKGYMKKKKTHMQSQTLRACKGQWVM